MNIHIIKLITILALFYSHIRLIAQVGGQVFIQYMLDNEIIWDKRVDKPRLLFFIVFDGMFFLFWHYINRYPFSLNYSGILAYQILFLICMILCSVILFYTWTNHFTSSMIPAAKEISTKLITKRYSSILKKDEDIKKLYEVLNGKYFDCSIESFMCHIEQMPLGENPKIYWIHENPTNHNKINKQTLLELIINLFPCVYNKKDQEYSLVDINKIVINSYQLTDGSCIEINKSNLQQWRESHSKPLIEFRNLLKSSLSNT